MNLTDLLNPTQQYGASASAHAVPTSSNQTGPLYAVSGSDGDDKGGVAAVIDPNNALFWFGLFLLASAGLAGFATSARLGPVRGSLAVGKKEGKKDE